MDVQVGESVDVLRRAGSIALEWLIFSKNCVRVFATSWPYIGQSPPAAEVVQGAGAAAAPAAGAA